MLLGFARLLPEEDFVFIFGLVPVDFRVLADGLLIGFIVRCDGCVLDFLGDCTDDPERPVSFRAELLLLRYSEDFEVVVRLELRFISEPELRGLLTLGVDLCDGCVR